jgi:hypothetical protein
MNIFSPISLGSTLLSGHHIPPSEWATTLVSPIKSFVSLKCGSMQDHPRSSLTNLHDFFSNNFSLHHFQIVSKQGSHGAPCCMILCCQHQRPLVYTRLPWEGEVVFGDRSDQRKINLEKEEKIGANAVTSH